MANKTITSADREAYEDSRFNMFVSLHAAADAGDVKSLKAISQDAKLYGDTKMYDEAQAALKKVQGGSKSGTAKKR